MLSEEVQQLFPESLLPPLEETPQPSPTEQSSSTPEDDHQSPSSSFTNEKVNTPIKCCGYQPELDGNVFNNFPFQYLNESPDIVFENKHLHTRECMQNNYLVSSDDLQNVNQSCQMLKYSTKLKNVMIRANKTWSSSELLQINNKYLTHRQLVSKVEVSRVLSCVKLLNCMKGF